MAKSRDAFRTISEVSEWLETPAHVLRFWESRFSQVKPLKRAGGRRYYRPNDMLLLGGIKRLLHDDGITIKGVQKVLREQGVKYVAGLCIEPLDGRGTRADAATPRETTPVDALLKPSGDAGEGAPETRSTVFQATGAAKPALPEETRRVFTAPRADTGKAAQAGKPAPRAQELDRMATLYARLERLRDRIAADLG